jgi:predicted TIM-barrel fold metal-dependent hydrolase
MPSRRTFLQHSAAIAAAGLLPGVLKSAHAAAPATPRALVDWHSHFVSRAEVRYFATRTQPPRLIKGDDGVTRLDNVTTVSFAGGLSELSPSDIPARIAHLDANGIQRQLLTHTVALGLDATIPLEDLRPLYRAFNDELAEVVRRYPTRFLAVAALPAADPKWAAEELTRAHRDLGFIGGSLPLNAFATLEGARTLAPLFATAQKHGSHFFVHRGPANAAIPGQPPLEAPSDTDFARWTLISNTHLAAGGITLGLTDFLDPYPDVSVEIVMLAGFLPYLFSSIVPAAKANGIKDPLARLRRLYLDLGPYSRIGEWVRTGIDRIGADRILFGTDYGVGGGKRGDVSTSLATLEGVLSKDEQRLIFFENSRTLLGSKRKT